MSTLGATSETVKDESSVTGWVQRETYAFGGTMPLQFTEISYAGFTPTTASGITFQLLVKASRSDADSAAMVDVTNASLTITTAPLVVGYDIDTQAGANAGFEPNKTYYGELWITDATYGVQQPKEFQIRLNNPRKTTFP